MKILNDLEVAAALNDPKTVKVCRMENKFLCFTDYDQYLAFRKIATLDRGIFTAKVEELDLAEKVEELDLAEKVEELDLAEKVEQLDLAEKVEELDLAEKVEELDL